MPISRLLDETDLTPERRHVLQLAFDSTLRKLDLVDRNNDPICDIVARKVIEIGASSSANALAISEIAYRQLAERSH